VIRKYIFIFALALAACAAPVTSSEETSTQAQAVSAPPTYDIGSLKAAGQCLDVYAFNNTNGAYVAMWDCNGLINQQWAYNLNTHQIVSKWNWKCLSNLDEFGDHLAYNIGTVNCDPNNPRQRWTLNWNGKITHDNDGLVLRRMWCSNATICDPIGGWTSGFYAEVKLGGANDADWEPWEHWYWQLSL